MGAWFAGVLAMVITYLVKDYLAMFAGWVIKKIGEYRQAIAENKNIKKNLERLKNAKSEDEKNKIEEDILNGK